MSLLSSRCGISKYSLSLTRCTANKPRRVRASRVMTRLYGRGWAAPPPRVESPRVESDGLCADLCGVGTVRAAGALEHAAVAIRVSADRTIGALSMVVGVRGWV